MEPVTLPIISRIATPPSLYSAIRRVEEKHPFLRDRAWLNDDLEAKLTELSGALATGSFQAQQVSFFYAMNDKPLRCASLDCRTWIAHEAIYGVLTDYFTDKWVEDCTFQPNQAEHLLTRCREWKQRRAWVAGADIRRFFDSVQHKILLDALTPEVPCPVTLRLIAGFLEAFDRASFEFTAIEPNHVHQPGKGLPAGVELVYLLVHLLLKPIDLKMKTLSSGHYGRYLDDFLFFTDDPDTLYAAAHELESTLSLLGLELNPSKTFFQSCAVPIHFLRSTI